MGKGKMIWTQDLSKLKESLDESDSVLEEIELSSRKLQKIPEAKEIQRLCVLIAARYAQAASAMYGVIRNQEQEEKLRELQAKINKNET